MASINKRVKSTAIREGNAYIFSKYPPFDGMGDAYFKGYTCLMFLPNVPGAMFIPESRVGSSPTQGSISLFNLLL